MYYRDEDPNRTGDPDQYDYFHKFIGDITGRDPDPDFFVKSDDLPGMTQAEIDEAQREVAERQKQLDYFMKRQINQYAKSSKQRDMMYQKYNLGE